MMPTRVALVVEAAEGMALHRYGQFSLAPEVAVEVAPMKGQPLGKPVATAVASSS